MSLKHFFLNLDHKPKKETNGSIIQINFHRCDKPVTTYELLKYVLRNLTCFQITKVVFPSFKKTF